MKRPLRTALADALYLRELRELRDLRHHRHQMDRRRCGMEPCGLGLSRAEVAAAEGRGVARKDYRTPDHCETDGDRRGTGFLGDGRYRSGSSETEPDEDNLFLFLKSLHQFLTAPQDAATTGSPGSGERADSLDRADRKADHG
ncbi:hypothetical protein ACWEFL_07525 [Streptomyces sp. NPDC004838]